ncbi:MAG: hypothetical protein WBV59_02830 [Anaerolineae bacterium]
MDAVQTGVTPAGRTQPEGVTPSVAQLTFDDWFGGVDDATKALVDQHVRGLKSALDAERADRKAAEKALRDTASKLEAGSAARVDLEAQAERVAATERRASFYEVAHAAGVADLKLAWLAAESSNLFTRRGEPDIEALRQQHPALFGAPTAPRAPGNAGAGAGQAPTPARSMNDFIRASAGILPR